MPAHARARRRWRRPAGRARARARARVRVWVWVRVPYPAWFFLNWVSWVWVTRSIPASLSRSEPHRQRLSRPEPLRQRLSRQLDGQQLRWLGRTVATVQTEPLQLFVRFGPVGPSRSAINSAPNSQLKTHNTPTARNLKEILSLSLSVLK